MEWTPDRVRELYRRADEARRRGRVIRSRSTADISSAAERPHAASLIDILYREARSGSADRVDREPSPSLVDEPQIGRPPILLVTDPPAPYPAVAARVRQALCKLARRR